MRLLRYRLFAPIVLAPALPEIMVMLGVLAGAVLSIFFHPIVHFIGKAIEWLSNKMWEGIGVVLGFAGNIDTLAHSGWGLAVEAWNHVGALEHTIANLGGAVAGAMANAFSWNQVVAYVGGAQGYVIGVAESLYNAAVSHADGVGQAVLTDAENLYNASVSHADGVGAAVLADAENLYNAAVSHADGVGAAVVADAQQLYNQAHAYTDAVAGTLEQVIGQDRVNARTMAEAAAAAATGALAAAISTTYDPCCNFLRDEVSPAWNRVKGLLGKLTRRGPLAMVLLAAVAETVEALDSKEILARVVQARQQDQGSSVAALRKWGRLTAA